MALTLSSSRVFNGNVGKQALVCDSTGSKCSCCPYGYHIDLDFVRYCEAVAADTSTDRSTIERRKKRERRRQCQSMEILLGLVDPVLTGSEKQLPEISHECTTTLPRSSSHERARSTNVENSPAPALDLSDVVGDFEATLRRFSKPSNSIERTNRNEIDAVNPVRTISNNAQHQVELASDFDNASIGSGNSNLSTGALQSIREQMAVSLERMRELEEQVKTIPMLEVQVSVLKEEKRGLQRKVEELNETRKVCQQVAATNPSQSLSLSASPRFQDTPKTTGVVSTRDMGIMCSVMMRDVGVSHQQIRTRDVGMITSTPLQRPNDVEDYTSGGDASTINSKYFSQYGSTLDDNDKTSSRYLADLTSFDHVLPHYVRGPVKLSCLSRSATSSPQVQRKNSMNLKQSPIKLQTTSYNSDAFFSYSSEKQSPESKVEKIDGRCEDATLPEKMRNEAKSTETVLRMRELRTPEEVASIVDEAIKAYRESKSRSSFTKGTQSSPIVDKLPRKTDREVQVSEPFRMRTHVGIMVKPKSCEVGTEAGPGPGTRTIAVGPDPVSTQSISLNSMNSRSHSFNYGDTRAQRKTTKTVGVCTEDLVTTTARGTDVSGLVAKKRDFGTSPMRKTFVDVSVGDSLKPHISISCAANYCDNCKETIKNLAKELSSSTDTSCNNNQTSPVVSRIPRPSHINLNSADARRQFKRQDTYTKLPASVIIRYDADNREQYQANNLLQQLETEVSRNDKIEFKATGIVAKEIIAEDKSGLSDDAALFHPIRDKPREKVRPSKEMRAALKVLNDNLKKSPSKSVSHQAKNASNVIQQEWFKISSALTANPHDVEDYLDCFEEFSSSLLEYIVNMTDSTGNTAMHFAVSHGNFDVVSILLDSKVCDINKSNIAGYTPVMLAALAEPKNSTQASVANRLFQMADVNVRAKLHGQTALMLAVSHGRADMTKLLLDAGAAVNIQDEDGSTALMCAAEHGHPEIVKLLLAHPDCDSTILDIDGSSALKIALEAGNRDIGVLLYAHERMNRGTSPYSSMRRSRRGSKPTTPTSGASPSAPVSPAPSRRFDSSTNTASKYSGK